jgi:hypothetical protein
MLVKIELAPFRCLDQNGRLAVATVRLLLELSADLLGIFRCYCVCGT